MGGSRKMGNHPYRSPARLTFTAFGIGLALGCVLVGVISLPFLFPSNTVKAGVEIKPQGSRPAAPVAGADADDFIDGTYWALIIGINKYPTMDKDKQLDAARKDAEAVSKILVERYGFSKERMVELYDEAASRSGIIRAFSSLKRRLKDKDSLFIYYAGHGEYEDAGRGKSEKAKVDGMGYWIPSDAELDDPSSYVFNSQVRDYLANIPARHIYLVADSCFSGSLMGRTRQLGLSKSAIQELWQLPSRWVLASGGLYPVPDAADKAKNGHSTFAWHLMKLLRDNKKPYLLAKDLAEPIAIRVSNEVQGQLPRSAPVMAAGDEGGQFVFRLKREFQQGVSDVAKSEVDRNKMAGELSSLEEQAKKAEEELRKQQEEFAKRKQAMLDRIKQAQEQAKRNAEEEEKALEAAVKDAEEKAKREEEARQARLKSEDERAKKLEEERLVTARKFEQEQREREQKAKEAGLTERQRLEVEIKVAQEREQKRLAETQKKKVEEERRLAEAKVKAEMERQMAEEQAKAERERVAALKRQEEAARKAEEARLIVLAKESEEQKRKLAEVKKKAEEMQRMAEQALSAKASSSDASKSGSVIVEATLRPFQAPRAKAVETMITIPAGEFIMGSKAGAGQPDESPQRTVYLDAYAIDKYEVTVEQYAAYLKQSGAEPPDFWERAKQKEDGTRPVVGVDWLDAQDFCEFYGKQLPTEAQWEKAARGTDGRPYPWGSDDPGPLFANFASGVAFTYAKSLASVGSYESGKSVYGVYDMVGNVWEWVRDNYDKAYYQAASLKNPAGPENSDYKVIRGGSWSKRPAVARLSGRMYLTPNTRSNSLGLRCVGEAR